jgi:hypothetical protein
LKTRRRTAAVTVQLTAIRDAVLACLGKPVMLFCWLALPNLGRLAVSGREYRFARRRPVVAQGSDPQKIVS